MKGFTALAIAVAIALPFGMPANAQQHDHGSHHGGTVVTANEVEAPLSEGIVRKVDKDAKKLTIKHGDLRNLGMGPMTMGFLVSDQSVFDKVKVGDKVAFVADMVGGKLTATKVEVVK